MSKAPWYKPWARRKEPEQRSDGWQSALMGIGMPGRDKRGSLRYQAVVVTDHEARELWRGNDIAKKAIEVVPEEMFRQGFDIRLGDEGKKVVEEVMSVLEDLDVDVAMERAVQYERAYGGAAILPVVNDGARDMAEPLRPNSIMAIDSLKVYEPRELRPATYYTDPRSSKYGLPATYTLVPMNGLGYSGLQEIHESRLVIFPGIRVSNEDEHGTQLGWGDSVLTVMQEVMTDFGLSWSAAGVLVGDFAQAVYKFKNLAAIFAADKDGAFFKRMQALDASRSVLRGILLDSEEDYERKATPVTGLPELLDRFATRLAAAADMPVTRLFGMSPAGLNSTGEMDARFWYDRVAAQQRRRKKQLEQVLAFALRSRSGPLRGQEPQVWSVEFRPLWQPSEQERAQTRLTQAQIDEIYIRNGVVSPEEVALSRFGGDTYSLETTVDFRVRELLEAPDDESVPAATGNDEDGREDSDEHADDIEERDGAWVVVSKAGRVLGSFETEEDALAQLAVIEADMERRRT
jgi:uncharacterized protein